MINWEQFSGEEVRPAKVGWFNRLVSRIMTPVAEWWFFRRKLGHIAHQTLDQISEQIMLNFEKDTWNRLSSERTYVSDSDVPPVVKDIPGLKLRTITSEQLTEERWKHTFFYGPHKDDAEWNEVKQLFPIEGTTTAANTSTQDTPSFAGMLNSIPVFENPHIKPGQIIMVDPGLFQALQRPPIYCRD